MGQEGVSLVDSQGRPLTVRFEECAGLIWSRTGLRRLYGRDGFAIQVDPDEWQNGAAAVRMIDQRLPPDRFIPAETPRRPLTAPPLARPARSSNVRGSTGRRAFAET